MAVQEITNLNPFAIREGARGFLISLKASNRYAKGYLENLGLALALLSEFAERQDWPPIPDISTGHIEEYLLCLKSRPLWFGERKTRERPSQSYIETQYRRIKRFFAWLVQRGHIEVNPLDLIPHPHLDEKTVPTVSEREIFDLFRRLDFHTVNTPGKRLRVARNRAVLYLLWDTPGWRNEIGSLTLDAVDLDAGAIRVMGKGRREHWMPIGSVVVETLWEYLRIRAQLSPRADASWVTEQGIAMRPGWLYLMIKRLGERSGVADLHTHRFRHTWTMNMLRSGMPEQMIRVVADWKKIPETYFRTLAAEDVARVHREISPADKLWQGWRDAIKERRGRQRKSGQGKL